MATCNGGRFVRDQLESIRRQDHSEWSLIVGDDGSTDQTLRKIHEFAHSNPNHAIQLRHGPRKGSTANFLHLLCDAALDTDFIALADQDDVWLPDKLSRAIAALEAAGSGPALYGARTVIVDHQLKRLGLSPLFARKPTFGNALVQNIAGGNTMVLNRKAHDLVIAAGAGLEPVCHDWWLYQLISGCGGQVIYDPHPCLLYRQHEANQIGSNMALAGRIRRISAVLSGRFSEWNTRNIRCLRQVSHLLTDEAREILDRFEQLRHQRGFLALTRLRGAGVYRQTAAGNASLALAAMLGRL
ncbi:glycosyltransferase family 2 protein [Albidovulum inexpectatum]